MVARLLEGMSRLWIEISRLGIEMMGLEALSRQKLG
jgi:hypothetical protein